MTKNYTKPIVTIDSGMAEGVYAASGATKGTLNVTYYGVIHAAFVDACGRNDGTDAITQDNLFHDAIVRGAHNEYVEEFSHTMILHIQRIKYDDFHCDRLRKISVSQHGEILQTIQARDSARAKELMRSHWLCSMENSLRDVAGMIHGVGGESGQDVLTK